jgi:hypothetical protein
VEVNKTGKKRTIKFFFSEVKNSFYVTTSQRNKTLKTALQSHYFEPDLELSDYHKNSQQSIKRKYKKWITKTDVKGKLSLYLNKHHAMKPYE